MIGIELLIGFVCLVGLYFLPTIVAFRRKHPSANSIFVINLFLGWTAVFWVIALSRAVAGAQPQQIIVHNVVSPPAVGEPQPGSDRPVNAG